MSNPPLRIELPGSSFAPVPHSQKATSGFHCHYHNHHITLPSLTHNHFNWTEAKKEAILWRIGDERGIWIGLKILCFLSNIWIGLGVMSMCLCVCILSLGLRGVIVCLSVDLTAVFCCSHFVQMRYNISRAGDVSVLVSLSLTSCLSLASGNRIHYTLQCMSHDRNTHVVNLASQFIPVTFNGF